MPSPGPDACLVSMPYASLQRPSLALGLLKSAAESNGVRVAVMHPNLWFAEAVGLRRYSLCGERFPTELMVGEWTFAGAAFADAADRDRDDAAFVAAVVRSRARLRQYREPSARAELEAELWAVRDAATRFVDAAARRVLATGAAIVGCTSTFEQHVASLALLRRIRELEPSVITMMGGANCETSMGRTTHEAFAWVDYVVSGEGDELFATLCRLALQHGRAVPLAALPAGVLGPAHRRRAPGRSLVRRADPARALFRELDRLPIPDFDDYFQALEGSRLRAAITPGIPIESSRGCWWGAVHHCTFCGLNGSSMTFRSKSPDRLLDEMAALERRHGISRFKLVDNILDMKYFRSVLPALAADPVEREIFYEVKANLTREQVGLLRRAGVTWIQPGIESLSSEVLRLMDKGLQGHQNVQLLKWTREHGVWTSWFILWGSPGEQDDWYRTMAEQLPLLEHLQAPNGLARLRFERYSVYHHRARELGLELHAVPAMAKIYPLGPDELDELAYFFAEPSEADPFDEGTGGSATEGERPGLRAVAKAARSWRKATWGNEPPVLTMTEETDALVIRDTRRCASAEVHVLQGLPRAVYRACDRAPTLASLARALTKQGLTPTDAELRIAVEALREASLLLAMDDRLVALAIRGTPPPLPPLSRTPGGQVAGE